MVKKIVQVPVEFQTCTRMPDASCCVTCNVIILQTTSVNAVFHYVRFARAGGACFESRKFFNSQGELNNARSARAGKSHLITYIKRRTIAEKIACVNGPLQEAISLQ